jgi:hypothetical protein
MCLAIRSFGSKSCGVRLRTPTDALGRLAGKQLVLGWVEVGYPAPADNQEGVHLGKTV